MNQMLLGRNVIAAAVMLAVGAFLLTFTAAPGNVAHADPLDRSSCGHPHDGHDDFRNSHDFDGRDFRDGGGVRAIHVDPSIENGVPALGVAVATDGRVVGVCVATADGQSAVVRQDGPALDGCISITSIGWSQVQVSRGPSCPAMTHITVLFVGHNDFDPFF